MTLDSQTLRQFEESDRGLLVRAPAKINLNLLVGPRRPDGFHDLDSLVVKVSLYDELLFTRTSQMDAVNFSCEGADCGDAEKNLVYRAAKLLQAYVRERGLVPADRDLGVRIRLAKRTPPGKGLGGGSSDAAATLLGLQRLWGLSIPQHLPPLAASLGSDVPLFLGPASCRMTGRGEILQLLEVRPFCVVLFLPELFCATPAVYKTFDQLPTDDPRPLPARQLDAALLREPPSRWRTHLVNDLLPPAVAVCPPLQDLQAQLQARTQVPVHMSGSGSALFAACDDLQEATRVVDRLEADHRRLCVVVRSNGW